MMNTFYTRALLAVATALLAAISLPTLTYADPTADPNRINAAYIDCARTNTDRRDIEDCMDSWSSNRADEIVCNHNYPHTPGSRTLAEEQFAACLEGYRNGDAHCVSSRSPNGAGSSLVHITGPLSPDQFQQLNEACNLGAAAQTETEGAAESSSSGSSSSSSGRSTGKIGPPPQSARVENTTAPGTTAQDPESCSFSGFMGSLMCQGAGLMGQMADSSLAILGAFMKVPPLETDPQNPIYKYWEAFRQIANIMFIIAFMVVVYSYVTNLGLSNYSIKRMVPRIIAAALLINISFYVCSVLVDTSNIVGSTIYGTVDGMIETATSQAEGQGNQATNQDSNEEQVAQVEDNLQTGMAPAANELTTDEDGNYVSWAGVVALALSVVPATYAFVSWGGFAALLPILVSVLLAVVIVVITLLLRQVLIILFIIVSPLAFAAIILPNTKEFFDRWSRAFIPTLMLYPVIALLFAAGTAASSIIAFAAGGSGFPERLFYTIMAMGMQIVPLLLVPKAMQMGGGMLSSFAGASHQKTAGIQRKTKDYSNKKIAEGDKKSLNSKNPLTAGRRRRAHGRLQNRQLKSAYEKAQDNVVGEAAAKRTEARADEAKSEQATSAEPDANDASAPVTAGLGNNAISDDADETIINEVPKDEEQENADARLVHQQARVKAQAVEAEVKNMQSDGTVANRDEMLRRTTDHNDDIKAMAAISHMVGSGDDGAAIEIVKNSDKLAPDARRQLVDSLSDGRLSDHPLFKDADTRQKILNGEVTSENFHETVVSPAINKHDFSAADQANMSPDTLKEIHAGLQTQAALPAAQRTVSNESARDFVEGTNTLMETPKLRNTVGREKPQLDELIAIRNSGAFK